MVNFPPRKLLATALFHCLIGACGWYHYTAMNSMEPFIRKFTNESIPSLTKNQNTLIWTVVSTIFIVGGIIGSLCLSFCVEKLGRRFTIMILKNLILIIGCLMEYLARKFTSLILLFIGRIVVGVASAPNLFLPTFMAECAPIQYRGIMSAICSLGLQLWAVLGTVAGLPQLLGTEERWHYALLLPAIPGLIHLLATPWIPESPKHLFITKGDRDTCEKAIKFYHGSDVDVEAVLDEYKSESQVGQNDQSVGLWQILKTRHLRWPFFLCIVASMSIAADASDIAYQYSTGIMMDLISGPHSALFTVLLIQVPSFLAAVTGMILVEITGRKILFLSGLFICTIGNICLFVYGFIYSSDSATAVNISGLLMILVGDSLGPSIVRTFLAGELCPQISRSVTGSLQLVAEAASSTLASFYYPPVKDLIGTYVILPFLFFCISSFLFLLFFLPETKNRSVNEVIARWMDDDDEIEALMNSPSEVASIDSLENLDI